MAAVVRLESNKRPASTPNFGTQETASGEQCAVEGRERAKSTGETWGGCRQARVALEGAEVAQGSLATLRELTQP